MSDKILELRNNFNMHNKTKLLLFISIATNNMVKYGSTHPECVAQPSTCATPATMPTPIA